MVFAGAGDHGATVVRVTAQDASGNSAHDDAALTLIAPQLAITSLSVRRRLGRGLASEADLDGQLRQRRTVTVALSRGGGSTWTTRRPRPDTGARSVDGHRAQRVVGATARDVGPNPAVTATANLSCLAVGHRARQRRRVWTIGSTRTISWRHNLRAADTVNVQLSRNNGSTWTTLATRANGTAGTSTFDWVVTGATTTNARIRVVWTAQTGISDQSDAKFRIR